MRKYVSPHEDLTLVIQAVARLRSGFAPAIGFAKRIVIGVPWGRGLRAAAISAFQSKRQHVF